VLFGLAVLWLAGIGRPPPPPDPLAGIAPRLAALEARPVPDLAPLLARVGEAEAAAAEARRAAEAATADLRRSTAAATAELRRDAEAATVETRRAAEERAAALDRRLIAIEAATQAEERRMAALEQAARRPVADPAALAALAGRVDRLAEGAAAREAREAEQERARDTLTRALEARIAAAERSTGDRVAALETATGQRLAGVEAALAARAEALERGFSARLATIEAREQRVAEAEARLVRLVAAGAARTALEEGRPLGAALAGLGEPPAALARFATAPPPTEAALRLAYADAARAARAAAEPEQGGSVLDAAAQRLGGLVTIRRGEELLLGNQADATLDAARRALEAGDLAGAVARLGRLPATSRAAMSGWLAEAEALLAARAALARLLGD
jgi:hypothetical protein